MIPAEHSVHVTRAVVFISVAACGVVAGMRVRVGVAPSYEKTSASDDVAVNSNPSLQIEA